MMMNTAVIDPAAIGRLEEWGGRRLVAQMVDLFLNHAPDRLENLREGLQNGDAEVVERAAHSLKSTAANLGAIELGQVAAKIEEIASAGHLAPVAELLPRVEAEFERAKDILSVLERKP